jgi:hypothetical protein
MPEATKRTIESRFTIVDSMVALDKIGACGNVEDSTYTWESQGWDFFLSQANANETWGRQENNKKVPACSTDQRRPR